jgi:hypothetical protein
MQLHRACHRPRPWLISFSLDAKAFLDSIAITSRRWHTAGDAWCCSSVSDTAHCYFGSTLSFSGFCAVAHPANAPQSHSGGGAPDSFRLSHDIRCSARGERCILGAGSRADHRALGCDLAGRSLRADGDALLFRRATLCLGRSSDCYCRRYIVGCCVRPMSPHTKHLTTRCSEPRPGPMRSLHVVSTFSLQPRALPGAVADLGLVRS